jgi:hypothetical protein
MLLKDITVVYLLMGKLVQEKVIVFLDIMKIKVLCQHFAKKFLISVKKYKITSRLKYKYQCLKYIMRKYKIY